MAEDLGFDTSIYRHALDNVRRNKLNFERIFEKYSNPFLESDIVDLTTMTISNNEGHVNAMTPSYIGKVELAAGKKDMTFIVPQAYDVSSMISGVVSSNKPISPSMAASFCESLIGAESEVAASIIQTLGETLNDNEEVEGLDTDDCESIHSTSSDDSEDDDISDIIDQPYNTSMTDGDGTQSDQNNSQTSPQRKKVKPSLPNFTKSDKARADMTFIKSDSKVFQTAQWVNRTATDTEVQPRRIDLQKANKAITFPQTDQFNDTYVVNNCVQKNLKRNHDDKQSIGDDFSNNSQITTPKTSNKTFLSSESRTPAMAGARNTMFMTPTFRNTGSSQSPIPRTPVTPALRKLAAAESKFGTLCLDENDIMTIMQSPVDQVVAQSPNFLSEYDALVNSSLQNYTASPLSERTTASIKKQLSGSQKRVCLIDRINSQLSKKSTATETVRNPSQLDNDHICTSVGSALTSRTRRKNMNGYQFPRSKKKLILDRSDTDERRHANTLDQLLSHTYQSHNKTDTEGNRMTNMIDINADTFIGKDRPCAESTRLFDENDEDLQDCFHPPLRKTKELNRDSAINYISNHLTNNRTKFNIIPRNVAGSGSKGKGLKNILEQDEHCIEHYVDDVVLNSTVTSDGGESVRLNSSRDYLSQIKKVNSTSQLGSQRRFERVLSGPLARRLARNPTSQSLFNKMATYNRISSSRTKALDFTGIKIPNNVQFLKPNKQTVKSTIPNKKTKLTAIRISPISCKVEQINKLPKNSSKSNSLVPYSSSPSSRKSTKNNGDKYIASKLSQQSPATRILPVDAISDSTQKGNSETSKRMQNSHGGFSDRRNRGPVVCKSVYNKASTPAKAIQLDKSFDTIDGFSTIVQVDNSERHRHTQKLKTFDTRGQLLKNKVQKCAQNSPKQRDHIKNTAGKNNKANIFREIDYSDATKSSLDSTMHADGSICEGFNKCTKPFCFCSL